MTECQHADMPADRQGLGKRDSLQPAQDMAPLVVVKIGFARVHVRAVLHALEGPVRQLAGSE